jgi:hypothetical protein
MMYALTGSFGSHLKKLLYSIYLLLFLALAHEAIPAIAPPELINRVTYISTYIVIGEVVREGTAEQ